MKIIFIFSCSGMFRNVPACSGMFRVPGFIDGHRKLADAIVSNIVEKCDVTLLRAIQPHSTFCASYVSSHISLSLSSTIHIGHIL